MRRLIILLSICPLVLNGQANDLQECDTNLIRIINQAYFSCYIQLPADFKMENDYTLLIALHGGGGSFESFRNIWERFTDPQFIMAIPEAPYKWLLGGEIGYDWSAWPSQDTSLMKDAIKLTSSYIETIIKNLKERYAVNKVYLMGFSQGSIIAQTAGIDNHSLLEGIIICSGPEIYHPGKPEIAWPSAESVRAANHLKIFIAHGNGDQVVDPNLAKISSDQYLRWGYDVNMLEFEGKHEISGKALQEIQKWMN